MKKQIVILSLLSLISISIFSSCSKKIEVKEYQKYLRNEDINLDNKIKNVILFIGDGMGPNHVEAGAIRKGSPICFQDPNNRKWTYHAYSNTDSLTSTGFRLDFTKSILRPEENPSLYDGTPSPYSQGIKINSGSITCYTDSAAGATALACGQKTTNSRIGLDIRGLPIDNLVEIASSLNKKTGVISTDTMVGATPSAFTSHVGERHQADEIINSMANSPIDLFISKIDSAWSNNKETNEVLYTIKGYDNIVYKVEDMDNTSKKELVLLDTISTNDEVNKHHNSASLTTLTSYALDSLDNDNGFFLMVEGANIDKKSHSNQAGEMLSELLAFDEAINEATLWADARNDTLIIVTADHETGGLYYNREEATQDNIVDLIKWKTYNHSRTRVTVDVYGDIQEFTTKYEESFSFLENKPYWDNTDVFKLCASYL